MAITAQIDGTNNAYVAWFGGGVNYPAGAYVVTYLHGAYNWHDGSAGYWGNAAAVTDGNGNETVYDPAPTFGDATINASQATVEAYFSDPSRNSLIYNHRGGRIGVRCLDGFTGDNTHGDPDPVFSLAASGTDDLKIVITSADGTQRRWLPRVMLGTPSWQIERYGGYGQCTLQTSLDYTAKSPIQMGDRVEIFYKGVRQYRGYVTERRRSSENPRKTTYTCYGAYVWLRKQIGGRNYAFAVDGVDASESFAAFAQDTLLTAIGPQGIRLVSSVQALTIGTLEQALTARQELAGDVLDGLMDRCGNLAIWGVDVDAAGSNRLYIRPTDPAYPPTYMIPVPSPFVEVGDSEEQGGDVVNQLVIKGGAPQFPQLIHNGAFELPVPAGGPGSNVILAGSFEFGAPGSMDWSFANGASTEAGKNSPPAVINAYLGDRYLELDHIGPPAEQASQSETAALVAGHQYTFSFRAASEIEAPIGDPPFVSGHATITIKDAGDATLFTQTLTVAPQGQSWDYLLTTFQMPTGAAAYEVLFALDSITPNSGQQGGLCIDDVQLYDSDSVTQDGWYVEVVDTPAEVIAVNWVYPSSWDGGYCVYLDATASNADNHDLKLTPQQGNRYKVSSGQDLTVNVWLKSPPVSTNPNPPEFFLELRWYDGSGHQISTSRSAHFTPGYMADWTNYTLTAFAPDNVASGDANITWRSAGSLLVDGFSVIDAAGTQPTGPADYMADGAVQFVIRADDAGLAAYRTAQGLGAAPYAASIASYGPQADTVQDDSILDRSGAYAVADAKFQAGALPYYRPSVRVLGDVRPYWPGQTVSLQGKDGPSLAPTPLPISRIQGIFEAGTLKLTLQPFKEQPDPILVFKKLARQAAQKYGTPAGSSSGGGYTSTAGATVTGASNKVQVDAADTTPGFLATKIVSGENTTVTINDVDGDETLQVNVPTATRATAGVVKAGAGLDVAGDGTLSVAGGGSGYTLPPATNTTLGGVKVGSGLAVAGDGTLSATGGGEGGSNASSGLYDISMGVPLLSAFTRVDPTSIMTFTEHTNKALVMKVTGTTPGSANVQGLALAVPTAPYSVASLMLYNGVPHEYFGIVFGFRESSTGKLDVLIASGFGIFGPCQYLHMNYSDPMTRASNTTVGPNGVLDDGKPMWYHIGDDGTNVTFGISSDGSTPYTVYSFAKSGGYLGAYDEIFIGILPEGSAGVSATGMSVTCLCYDEHGATRQPGPAGSSSATTSMPGQATFYDPGDVTAWTWVNQTDYSTTADTTYYNSALNLHVPAPTTMGQDNRRILVQSLPASPWTVTAAFNGQIFPTNYYNFGIAIYNSGLGHHIGFTPLVEQSGNPSIALIKYNSVHQGGTGDGAYISFVPSYNMWTSGVMWYRVTDDGTTRNFYFSNNGVVWMLVYSVASSDYGTMDSAGFYVNPVNSSSQYDTNIMLLSWHIDNSILGPTTPA